MDAHVTSPPSIRLNDVNPKCPSSRPSSRELSHGGRAFGKCSGPMSIPNSMHEDPPPALPPPRHLEDLAAGNDPGWLWGNKIKRSGEFGSKGSGTVSPNSSLRGGSWDTSIETRSSPERPQVVRRDSSTSTIKSTKDTEMYDAFRHGDEGYHSLSGSSLAYQLVFLRLSSQVSKRQDLSIPAWRMRCHTAKVRHPIETSHSLLRSNSGLNSRLTHAFICCPEN